MAYSCKAERKCMVALVVTRLSYGKALHYDLSMFLEFGSMW